MYTAQWAITSSLIRLSCHWQVSGAVQGGAASARARLSKACLKLYRQQVAKGRQAFVSIPSDLVDGLRGSPGRPGVRPACPGRTCRRNARSSPDPVHHLPLQGAPMHRLCSRYLHVYHHARGTTSPFACPVHAKGQHDTARCACKCGTQTNTCNEHSSHHKICHVITRDTLEPQQHDVQQRAYHARVLPA